MDRGIVGVILERIWVHAYISIVLISVIGLNILKDTNVFRLFQNL